MDTENTQPSQMTKSPRTYEEAKAERVAYLKRESIHDDADYGANAADHKDRVVQYQTIDTLHVRNVPKHDSTDRVRNSHYRYQP